MNRRPRIVSLLPSATEIVCQLGLRDHLVGVTHECDFPPGVETLPKVTRTRIPHDATSGEIDALVRERLRTEKALYSLDLPVLHRLAPDLIVTQALCDVCAVAEREVTEAVCDLPGQAQVVNLEPTCLQDVFECLIQVGRACDCEDAAIAVAEKLRDRVEQVRRRSLSLLQRPSVLMLEWVDPPFSAGHWTPELVEIAGGREIIGKAGERSTPIEWHRVVQQDPEVLVLACCGFDVERTLKDLPILSRFPGWNELRCVREDRVHVLDGSAFFSRPGPRLVESVEILGHCLHPTVHPLPRLTPTRTEPFLAKPALP